MCWATHSWQDYCFALFLWFLSRLSVFICFLTSDTGFGTIFTSDDRGIVYSKSLDRHLYTTTGGETDFTNVTSLRGVYITSMLSEGEAQPSSGSFIWTGQDLRSSGAWRSFPRDVLVLPTSPPLCVVASLCGESRSRTLQSSRSGKEEGCTAGEVYITSLLYLEG